jgi:membrane peptidoglycan carboxypeptidase
VPTQFNLGCKPTAKNSGSCYMPLNYGGIMNINGPISLRNALIKSLNIPAVKVMYLAGIKEVNKLANDMGLNLLNNYNYYGLSFVLGGAEVRLLDLTSAYGIFGNDGVKNNIVSIIKIIDMDKEEVYHKNNTDKKSVLSKNTARVINDMLTSHSPSSNIYFPGKKVAVKTGTTNDYRDV